MRLGLGGLVLLFAAMALAASRLQTLGGQSVSYYPGTSQVMSEPADVDRLAEWLTTFPPTTTVQIRGYYCEADRLPMSGDSELLYLAEHRALKLKHLLASRGLDPKRLTTVAYGMLNAGAACQATAIPYLGQ